MYKGFGIKLTFVLAAAVALSGCSGAEATDKAAATGPAAAPTTAQAEGAPAPTEAEQFLISQGATISAAFTSDSGLKAVVADRGLDRRLFYITPDGKHVILGTVFDAKGGNVTSNDMSRASIRGDGAQKELDEAALAKLWEQAGELDYITEGQGDKVAYVIFDPQCPYCHKLWEKLRDVVATGGTQVRWIPVAILSEDSNQFAAAIYQANNSRDALTEMNNRTLTGVKVTEKTAEKLERNLQLLRTSGYTGVPTVLYKDQGKVHATISVLSDEATFAKAFL